MAVDLDHLTTLTRRAMVDWFTYSRHQYLTTCVYVNFSQALD